MRAGALNALIEIQVSTPTRSTTGEELKNWSRLCRLWAKVEGTDTLERFSSDREIGYKLKFFTVRHRSDIKPQHRILYKQEAYDVVSIKTLDKLGREKFMQITGEIVEESPAENE